MDKENTIDRRTFMSASSAAALGMMVAPSLVKGSAKHVAPSDKINIGYIGTGTQGLRVLMEFLRHKDVHIAAVCDANRDSQDYVEWSPNEIRDKIRMFINEPTWGENNTGCRAGRVVGKEVVETFYKNIKGLANYKGCNAYEDYREMLEKEKGLDAVVILTPEHLHATIAIAAMRKGLHVITHKPISNVISEVRLATKVAAETGVATHMFCSASMQTTPLLCEWIWGGAIGQVREVHNWTTRPFWPQGMYEYPQDTLPVPDGLNWDLWLGPAEYRPYHRAYTHATFRGWYDFGTGPLGDMGHYSFYQIWKILKLGAPTTVEASASVYWAIEGSSWVKKVNKVSLPQAATVHWEFPERGNMTPVTLHWYDGGIRPPVIKELESDKRAMPDEGLLFVGDKGKILAGFSGNSPRIIPEKDMKAFKRPPQTLARPVDEIDQWVQACRGGEPAGARFEVAREFNETLCLGTIALRAGKKLFWDSEKMQITNDDDAQKLVYRKYRPGWELDV